MQSSVCHPGGEVAEHAAAPPRAVQSPSGSELDLVEQHPVVGAGQDVEEAVPLVEAAGVGVDLVDVDVHLAGARARQAVEEPLQQGGPDPLVAQLGAYVELLELADRAVEVRRVAERQVAEPDRVARPPTRPAAPAGRRGRAAW